MNARIERCGFISSAILLWLGVIGIACAQDGEADQTDASSADTPRAGSPVEAGAATSPYPSFGLRQGKEPAPDTSPTFGLPPTREPAPDPYAPGAPGAVEGTDAASADPAVQNPQSAPAPKVRYGSPNTLDRSNYPSGLGDNPYATYDPSQPTGKGSSIYDVRGSVQDANAPVGPYRDPNAGTEPGLDGVDPYLDPSPR